MDKDKITSALAELSPERLEKLKQLAYSQMTDEQRSSSVHEAIQDLKCREIMSKYL